MTTAPSSSPNHRGRPGAGRRAALRLLGAAGNAVPAAALRPLLAGTLTDLATDPEAARRAAAEAIARALDAGECAHALGMAATAARRADRRAEKVLCPRYRCLWIAVPKVASRSMIAALAAADPEARLVRGHTLEEIRERHPETRGWFTFAFVRDPLTRARAAWADKHDGAPPSRRERRWFIDPYHGLVPGMTFARFCRWLATPWGADAFADRHWLSQHRQLETAQGTLPDFIGHYETLEADWRTALSRAGLPYRALPHLNRSPRHRRAAAPDPESRAILRRRYAGDCALGGYGA